MILHFNSQAQDCKAHFEVNAGPNIDVCESGTVQLHGIIGGDATTAAWRGGKGTLIPAGFLWKQNTLRQQKKSVWCLR